MSGVVATGVATGTEPIIVFRVEEAVRGKARPRFTGRAPRVYTDGQTKRAQELIRQTWMACTGRVRVDGPVKLDVTVAFARPATHLLRDGRLSVHGVRAPFPVGRLYFDIDNTLKLVMDALSGCAYADDAQVVDAHITRKWAADGREHTLIAVASKRVLEEPA